MSKSTNRPPNWPSKTGNPSGKGRDINPPAVKPATPKPAPPKPAVLKPTAQVKSKS